MRTVADRSRRRRWDQPPPVPRTTGGVERAVFELLRLALGSGSRNVQSGNRWHPRRSVDMLFQLGGDRRVVIEYDAAYFHPCHGDDLDRSRQAFEVLSAYVIRIRESPLETRGFDGFVHPIGVPPNPDPQLCAAAVLLHLDHVLFLEEVISQEWRGEPLHRAVIRFALARFGAEVVSGGCPACRQHLDQFAQWYDW